MGIISGLIEQRNSIENPNVSLASAEAFSIIFGDSSTSASGIEVTTEKALGVPAVWAAVNFIGDTMATLPLQVFRDQDGDRTLAKNLPVYSKLHDVVNEDQVTSYKWRKLAMTSVLTGGRDLTYIERNKGNQVANLWRLDPSKVTVKQKDRRTTYEYKGEGKTVTYAASEIIDLQFMPASDGMGSLSPIKTLKNALGLAIGMEEYASRFFQNGGVPPLALEGPAASAGAIKRATAQIEQSVKDAMQARRNMLYMPTHHKLTPVGFKPEEGQLQAARLFQLQEVARIFGLPPVFLQDLSNGTYSNSEQQDLHVVKHTIAHWVEQWEQELNAKLFPTRKDLFVEFNLDGLLRGDFKTRMEGYALAIQNSINTPDEVRNKENLPKKGGKADKLFINTASQPIDDIGQMPLPLGHNGGPALEDEGGQDGGNEEE